MSGVAVPASSVFVYGAATVAPPQPYGNSQAVYTQQCIDQLQQEVQQHLAQLEQSRMHEQMLAAAIQQQQQHVPAAVPVLHSSTAALQQRQLVAGAAAVYSSSVALQTPAAMLPLPAVPSAVQQQPAVMMLAPPGVATAFAAPSVPSNAVYAAPAMSAPQISGAAASTAQGQLMLPPTQMLRGVGSSSSMSGPYWLLPSGELSMTQQQRAPQQLQQQQQLMSPSQQLVARWAVGGAGGFMQG
jgi:hypothetical protein